MGPRPLGLNGPTPPNLSTNPVPTLRRLSMVLTLTRGATRLGTTLLVVSPRNCRAKVLRPLLPRERLVVHARLLKPLNRLW